MQSAYCNLVTNVTRLFPRHITGLLESDVFFRVAREKGATLTVTIEPRQNIGMFQGHAAPEIADTLAEYALLCCSFFTPSKVFDA